MGLVSWVDMLEGDWRSRPTLLHGAAVSPRLYSGYTARQDQDNRMLHKARRFLLPSLAPLYNNTSSE